MWKVLHINCLAHAHFNQQGIPVGFCSGLTQDGQVGGISWTELTCLNTPSVAGSYSPMEMIYSGYWLVIKIIENQTITKKVICS